MAITYNVYRKLASGGAATQIATGLTSKYFVDTTAVDTTAYIYNVTSVASGGVSESTPTKDMPFFSYGGDPLFTEFNVTGFGRQYAVDVTTQAAAANSSFSFTNCAWSTDGARNVLSFSGGYAQITTNATDLKNVEVKMLARWFATGDSNPTFYIAARQNGGGTSYTGATVGHISGNIYPSMVNTTGGWIAPGSTVGSLAVQLTKYLWLRVVVIDRYCFMKYWYEDVSEPTTWLMMEYGNNNSSDIPQSGLVHFANLFPGSMYIAAAQVNELLSTTTPYKLNNGTLNKTSTYSEVLPTDIFYSPGVTATQCYPETLTDSTGLTKNTLHFHRAVTADPGASITLFLYNSSNLTGPATYSGAPAIVKPQPVMNFGPYLRIRGKSKATNLRLDTGTSSCSLSLAAVNYYLNKANTIGNVGRPDYYCLLNNAAVGGSDSSKLGTWSEIAFDYTMPINSWDVIWEYQLFLGIHDAGVIGDANIWDLNVEPVYPCTLAADGQTLTVDYGFLSNGPLSPTSAVTGFTVKVNGAAVTVSAAITQSTATAVTPGPTSTRQVVLTLATKAHGNARLSVSKTGGNLVDASATILPGFTEQEVTNNSTL